MVTAYEAMYIVDAQLPEDQLKAVVDKYTGVLARGNAEIDDIDIWEPRRLAYAIKNRREGRYIVVNFRSEPAAKDELVRIFGISDDILRAMVVKQDPRADRFPSKARAAESERREREYAARTPVEVAPAPAPEPVVTPEPEPEAAPVEEPAVEAAAEAVVEPPEADA